MKIQSDDPRLTNYLLGECTPAERIEVENALQANSELQKELEILRTMTQELSKALQNEPAAGLQPNQIMAIERHIQSRKKIIHWDFKETRLPWEIGIAIAASLTIGWVALDRLSTPNTPPPLASESTSEIQLRLQPANELIALPNQETQAPWEIESKAKTATFAANPDGLTYEAIQKKIRAGILPSPQEIQIESIINAFKVHDAPPSDAEPFKIHVQLSTCPWNPQRALARIALIAREGDSKESFVAEGVKWYFELNPQLITSYRILGYDNQYEKTGNELPANQRIPLNFQRIVLIEITPTNKAQEKKSTQPWFTVQIQHQSNSQQRIQTLLAFQGDLTPMSQTSQDFQFAAATAEFAVLLKKLPETEKATWSSALALARQGVGSDPQGERKEFVTLIEKAKNIASSK